MLDKINHRKPLGALFYTKYKVPFKEPVDYESWTVPWPYFLGYYKKSDNVPYRGNDAQKELLKDLIQYKEWIYDRFSKIPIYSKDISKLTNTIKFYEYLCTELK